MENIIRRRSRELQSLRTVSDMLMDRKNGSLKLLIESNKELFLIFKDFAAIPVI